MQFGQDIHVFKALYSIVEQCQILQLCQLVETFNHLNVIEWQIWTHQWLWLATARHIQTSNVTGRHRGPKKASGWLQSAVTKTDVTLRRVFIVECGIARFLCATRVFDRRRLGIILIPYLCAKFCFFRGPHCWASTWRKIAYSLTHSLTLPAYLLSREPKLSLRNKAQNWQQNEVYSTSAPETAKLETIVILHQCDILSYKQCNLAFFKLLHFK